MNETGLQTDSRTHTQRQTHTQTHTDTHRHTHKHTHTHAHSHTHTHTHTKHSHSGMYKTKTSDGKHPFFLSWITVNFWLSHWVFFVPLVLTFAKK